MSTRNRSPVGVKTRDGSVTRYAYVDAGGYSPPGVECTGSGITDTGRIGGQQLGWVMD